jgi:hypothetical protein
MLPSYRSARQDRKVSRAHSIEDEDDDEYEENIAGLESPAPGVQTPALCRVAVLGPLHPRSRFLPSFTFCTRLLFSVLSVVKFCIPLASHQANRHFRFPILRIFLYRRIG